MIKSTRQSRRDFLNTGILTALGCSTIAAGLSAAPAEKHSGLTAKVKSIEISVLKQEPRSVPLQDALQVLPGVGRITAKVILDEGISGIGGDRLWQNCRGTGKLKCQWARASVGNEDRSRVSSLESRVVKIRFTFHV